MAQSCGHCEFQGPLETKGQVVAETGNQEVQGHGDVPWTRYWVLSRCPVCHEPTLEEMWWYEEFSDPTDAARRVYPTPRDNSPVPVKVRKRLDAALKVKRIEPSSYAVGIRRMLEAVCNEEGATGNDLFAKLDDLAAKERIPETLAQVAHQLRKMGNLGAHDEDVEVAVEDVPLIEDLADAFLEYLYRAPAKLSVVRAGLEQRKPSANAS